MEGREAREKGMREKQERSRQAIAIMEFLGNSGE